MNRFQTEVSNWLISCFGEAIANDKMERNYRFLEEALELVQSAGCTVDFAHQLVDYVYSRPVGELKQELGGVMVTLASLCYAHNIDMKECGDVELMRVLLNLEKIRKKQAEKKIKSGPLP